MIPTFLCTIGAVCLLIALWPFGPYQLTLILARRLYDFPPTPDSKQIVPEPSDESFAICVCAYNEAATIGGKVEDLLRLREASGGDLDILIYVDGATDDTASILEPYRDRIRLVIEGDRRGKTYGMNLLVAQTRASIIMFTDANVRIDPNAIRVLRHYFADSSIGCVCSYLTYVNASQSATAFVGSAYWSFNEWSKGLETATGSVIGADGSLFAIRRCLHRPVPNGLIDDIFVSLGVLLAGYRVVRAPELQAFETHTTDAGDEFHRKVRIASQSIQIHFALWPELRRLDVWHKYKYVGHRLLRWIGGYFLIAAALLFAAAGLLGLGPIRMLTISGAILLLFLAAARARIGLAMTVLNVLLAFTGNVVGVWRGLHGERAITWEPPSSARASHVPAKGQPDERGA
ncbi:MAG: glycosyltransferase [Acidobacteria bacterium]|nr:glycosyltransferase [Acidobacteriota bacterium]